MDWRGEGMLLTARAHGETSAIIEVLTRDHGRHAGLVQGGASSKLTPVLQPGAQLSLEWRARLAEHLGQFRVDLIRSRAAAIMEDRTALSAFNAMGAMLVALLPEREPNPETYDTTLTLADAMATGETDWLADYARWEVVFLSALGFGLDFTACASSGVTEGLIYVSPRSGRAVSRDAGAPWAEKLLPLPGFLTGGGSAKPDDVRDALRMTGFFLEHWACPAFERKGLPEARARLIDHLERMRAAG